MSFGSALDFLVIDIRVAFQVAVITMSNHRNGDLADVGGMFFNFYPLEMGCLWGRIWKNFEGLWR